MKLIGDPERLRQVLVNLSSNAVKFTEKGNIDIRVEPVREDEEEVFLRFEILDTGIGIPQDRLDAIFESFTQADESTTRRFGGTGLGLSISKRLVELMGGEIAAESEKGRGSTLRLIIPFRKQEEIGASVMTRQNVRGTHILIVDADDTNRTILNKTLVSFGCFPEEVSNGKDALSRLSRSVEEDRVFDAILLDHQMPEMDVYAATREIRNPSSASCIIPVIAMTAHTMKGDREKCLAAGMDDYISKPVKPKELMEIVQRWACKQVLHPIVENDEPRSPMSSPVDMRHLQKIAGGEMDFEREITELFLKDTGKHLSGLKRAIDEGNASALEREAHTVKGAGLNMGAEKFGELAMALEKKGRSGSLEDAQNMLIELEAEFQRVKLFLERSENGGR